MLETSLTEPVNRTSINKALWDMTSTKKKPGEFEINEE
jgi:hypothetical protein